MGGMLSILCLRCRYVDDSAREVYDALTFNSLFEMRFSLKGVRKKGKEDLSILCLRCLNPGLLYPLAYHA